MLPHPGPCREPLGIPLTIPQAETVLQWDLVHRSRGVRASIVLDHTAAEEVIEITVASLQYPDWCIVRRPDGQFLVLDLPNDATSQFPSVQSALRHVDHTLGLRFS